MVFPSGASFSLRCLIYKVHAVPGGTLLLYVVSSRLSRTFFRKFLAPGPPRIAATCLSYHISFLLSRGFFFPSFPVRSPAPTALLEYQILSPLSIPFFPSLPLFSPPTQVGASVCFAGSAEFFAHSLLFISLPACYNE